MAEKGFGVKEVNLIGASGTPTITSPNNLNLNAVNVAISTNATIGGTLSVTGNVSVGATLTYEDVTNIDSVGIITARDDIKVVTDNKSITFGASSDLSMKHDGTNSYILNNTGSFIISADTLQFNNRANTETKAKFINNGAAELYWDATKKFETSSSGATVTGTLTATTFSGSGASLTNLPVSDSDIQVVYTVTANGSSAYRFAGNGVVSTADDPDLYLIRGQKYRFINNSGGSHPFQIRESSGGTAYSTGVTNNGAASGNIDFAPTFDSPAQLVYQCTSHGGMVGNIYLRDAGGQNTNVGLTTFVAGIDVDGGPINIINGGGAYNTHLNYNDSGINYVTSTNGGATYFRGSSNSVTTMAVQGSGPVDIDGDLRHLGDTDTMLQFGTDTISFDTAGAERVRIKSDGKVSIGNPSGSGTGALTIYPNSITGMGRLDVYAGGDENSQTQARNEVMRIGRGDILDSYYHSIWSATGSGSSNSHFLKFYVSNGNAGATNQKESLSMNGHGHVTKPNNLCLQYTPNGSINVTTGTVIYATEVFDVGDSNAYNTSNGEFTAPSTGIYRIQYEHFAQGAGRATAAIQKHNGSSWSTVKNGMRVYAATAAGANWPSVPTIFYLQLDAGEKFKIIHLEGTIHLNTPWNHMTVQLVQ